MNEAKEWLLGLLIGFIAGVLLAFLLIGGALENYARVNKNADGFYAQHDGKIYRLVEVGK